MFNKKIRLTILVVLIAASLFLCGQALVGVFDAEFYNERGFAALEKNEPAAAQRYFMMAIAVDPQWAISYNNLGVSFLQAGEPKKAQAMFSKAIIKDPALIEPRLSLGSMYIGERKFEAAANVLKQNLIRDAFHGPTLHLLSVAHLLNKDPQQAQVYAQTLLEHSEDAAILTELGSLFAQEGYANAAFPCFVKAQKVDNFYTPVYIELGKWYGNQNLFPQAISVWQDCLLVDPNNEECKGYIQQALRLMKERKKSKAQ